jgi:uncharacterized membrane protein YfcA
MKKICGDRLVCHNNICSSCTDNSDCNNVNLVCKSVNDTIHNITTPNITKICEHKNIFSDGVNYRDIIAMVLTFIVGMFAAIGGIGGGGFYVVIISSFLDFPISVASRISKSTILGIAITNTIHYLPLNHPYQFKPLVDYEVSIMMQPYILVGTIFGVLLNTMFPNWLLSLLLLSILVAVGIKILFKYRLTSENLDIELQNYLDTIEGKDSHVTSDKNKYYVLPYNAILIICWVIILIFSVLRGSKNGSSPIGVAFCSSLFWGLTVIQVLLLLVVGTLTCLYLYQNQKGKILHTGDVKWNLRNSFLLPPCLVAVGLIGALLGLGGSIVRTPIMIQLGMLPEVMVASNGYVLVYTASGVVIQYFIFDILPVDYSVVFMGIGFVSSLCGHLIFNSVVKTKSKHLLLILCILMFTAAGSTLGNGIYRLVSDINNEIYIGFKSPC